MMGSQKKKIMPLPSKGEAYIFPPISLTDIFDPQFFKVNPTLENGDVLISKDGGALAQIATLPVKTPAGSSLVEVSLNASEMTADKIVVQFRDQNGDEWGDLNLPLDVPTHTTDSILDFLDADIDETSIRATRFKKGTSTIIADKVIGDSFLPPNVKVTLREPAP